MTVWLIEITDSATVYIHHSSTAHKIVLTDDVYTAKQFASSVGANNFLELFSTAIKCVFTVTDHIFDDGK